MINPKSVQVRVQVGSLHLNIMGHNISPPNFVPCMKPWNHTPHLFGVLHEFVLRVTLLLQSIEYAQICEKVSSRQQGKPL